MPLVTVALIPDENSPTTKQKAEVIREITEVLSRILGKNPAATTVIIEEVAAQNWGVGGVSVAAKRTGQKTGTGR